MKAIGVAKRVDGSLMDDGKDISDKGQKPDSTNDSDSLRKEVFSPRVRIVGERAELLDTRRQDPPIGTLIGPTDAKAPISVTIMVKSKATEQEINDTLQKIIEHKQKPLNDAEFNARFGADPNSMAKILKFAKDNGLKASEIDDRSGRIVLKGSAKDVSSAFNVQLQDYKANGLISRERTGTVSVPKDIVDDLQGVFGLDNRRQADSHHRVLAPSLIAPKDNSSFTPDEVAKVYKFPTESMGKGQSVAIIELGGGLDLKDNAIYYKNHKLKEPTIQIVSVDDAKNSVGNNADREVALDSQVIGAVAPDAKQQLIFAPNTDQGFVDAITRAAFPEKGEIQNTAISISWGAPEVSWTDQAIKNLNMAFKKAALKGISVFAASGDNGAKDKSPDGLYNADYPASDPFVTGTGGTRLEKNGHEITWNDGEGFFGGASGGGISHIFEVPEFQKGITLPPSANNDNKKGRGVPDVSGDASPGTGYRIRVGGNEIIMGGTSAVAPLYAALTMRVNGALSQPVGYLNPFLYKKGGSDIFHDITDGNNNGYPTGPGWDAATGWGSIRGDKFLQALKLEQKQQKDQSEPNKPAGMRPNSRSKQR